ncbi:ABC transporter ATP-binding protein [Pseudomonas granadensis]|uniref:ATP-binding cassette domain-containing protein n=1 Tax=Pseudomonas granadensis TaxID=1421430 RepID=UPI0019D19F6E|nr:ABC transporter ATP-binding protein [Pseudomonas granadensis]MBN6805677.1 ABC transporter ATP-binding protein [Pseudomonas granadensis]MBN6832549.1 ABC transporter ATP-binding protein [Pseudomonas granadensis]MBN6839871.1 ABC transporter ATP-binding protein [Pseudomonas granadensis]MBN6869246.1 ABC transporter ATP-binding protein [Pseudomonas granadensis]
MIQIENLNKQFGAITAVEDVSFNVEEGQICVLLGPSGCGKTTTLKMINRLVTPTSGTIRINGRDTSELDSVTLKRSIGYVIQQVGLFPNMTVEENICVVPNLLGWDKNKSRKRAAELLEVVALDPAKFLKRYPCELSGGQQQRIGVARALAADPPVMLMDEPFGAIDPINREVIQDEFMRIQRLVNKTVLFVSHDIDEAVKMADCVALFHNGKIQQFGSSDDLLARPNSDFVANFMGGDRIMKRLRLLRAADVVSKVAPREHMQIVGSTSGIAAHSHLIVRPADDLRQVLSQLLGRGQDWASCNDNDGRFVGYVHQADILARLVENINPAVN